MNKRAGSKQAAVTRKPSRGHVVKLACGFLALAAFAALWLFVEPPEPAGKPGSVALLRSWPMTAEP